MHFEAKLRIISIIAQTFRLHFWIQHVWKYQSMKIRSSICESLAENKYLVIYLFFLFCSFCRFLRPKLWITALLFETFVSIFQLSMFECSKMHMCSKACKNLSGENAACNFHNYFVFFVINFYFKPKLRNIRQIK